MNSTLKTIFFVAFFTLILSSCNNNKQNYYYHVLLLEFNEGANVDQITKSMLKFKDISTVIEVNIGEIKSSKRNKIQNFSHCLVLKFENEKGLQDYIKDPIHEKFLKNHLSDIADIYTADFNSISIIE